MIERIRQIKRIIFLAHVVLLIAAGVFLLVYGVATAQDDDPPADTEPVTDVVVAETDEIGDSAELTAETPVAVDHDSIGVDVESSDDLGDQVSTDSLADKVPAEVWQFVAGFLLPLAITAVKRRGWTDSDIRTAALGGAFVLALIACYLRGELDNFSYTSTSVMTLVGTVWVSYERVWKTRVLGWLIDGVARKTEWGPAA